MTDTEIAISARRLTIVLWIVLVGIAAFRAWQFRYDLVNDTVSYMDMGDELFAGRPSGIVNGTWSPLYPIILGAWLHLLHPSMRWEFPAVHLLLLFFFVGTLASFDFFLRELVIFKRHVDGRNLLGGSTRAVIFIAYVVFASSTLTVIGVEQTNPDMLVAAAFILGCGLLLRIRRRDLRTATLLALGASIGFGYLAKAVMLPIGCILLAVAALTAASPRAAGRIVLYVGLSAAILCAPQVAALSAKRGHFTTNETGPFNYAVNVQGVVSRHWQGGPPDVGAPKHPTRKLLDDPPVFEFDGPLPGTYPLWFDISYWYDGVKPPFSLRRQVHVLHYNVREMAMMFLAIFGGPLVAIALLYGAELRDRASLRSSARFWIVLVPAAISLGLYASIHFEPRYVGGFTCVLLTAAVVGASLPGKARWARQLYKLCLVPALATFFGSHWPAMGLLHGVEPRTPFWRVAEALHDAGYGPGTKVATLEYGNMSSVLWARLARVKLVAEIYYRPDHPETFGNFFWRKSEATQTRALVALRSAGARVAVTEDTPRGPSAARWTRLADSDYYYLAL